MGVVDAARAWVQSQYDRLARTDSGDVGVSDYLNREGYVKRAKASWCFAGSSFLYSVFGLYLIYCAEVMDRKFPILAGLWWYEGLFLTVQGPISYWNDVYHFGLDKTASSVDRASALTLFFLQCGKWFVVPLDFPTNWIVFVLLWVAGIIFLIASTHFGNVLTCSGIAEKECGGAVVSSKTKANTSTEWSTARIKTRDLSGNNAPKAPALADDESSLVQLTEAGLERREQADGKRSKQKPRNRTPSGKKAALSNQLTVGSRKNSTASTVSTSASSTKSTRLVATQSTPTGEHAPSSTGTQAALVVETHFKAYLFWHTLWHVALPVPGILTLASFRTEYGLPVLPTWALSEDMFSHLVTGAW